MTNTANPTKPKKYHKLLYGVFAIILVFLGTVGQINDLIPQIETISPWLKALTTDASFAIIGFVLLFIVGLIFVKKGEKIGKLIGWILLIAGLLVSPFAIYQILNELSLTSLFLPGTVYYSGAIVLIGLIALLSKKGLSRIIGVIIAAMGIIGYIAVKYDLSGSVLSILTPQGGIVYTALMVLAAIILFLSSSKSVNEFKIPGL